VAVGTSSSSSICCAAFANPDISSILLYSACRSRRSRARASAASSAASGASSSSSSGSSMLWHHRSMRSIRAGVVVAIHRASSAAGYETQAVYTRYKQAHRKHTLVTSTPEMLTKQEPDTAAPSLYKHHTKAPSAIVATSTSCWSNQGRA
jgi:hypothetical protein